jgi:hypothetical protein
MPKRHRPPDNYIDPISIVPRKEAPSMAAVAMKVPGIVKHFDVSIVKQHQDKPDWSLYRIEFRQNVPFIVREMCDRCGKVWIPPRWRKLRVFHDAQVGDIYLETGICKDCINASVYVDPYLDGDPLTEKEAKALFYKYAVEYERAWRVVLAAAPRIAMTEQEWEHRCKFFNGCAICGGPIEARVKYFPIYLNGAHTAWNVLPMCNECLRLHYRGRISATKRVSRYRVFSTSGFFNKTKTIRIYLLNEMERHEIYMEPLQPFRKRFRETKKLTV